MPVVIFAVFQASALMPVVILGIYRVLSALPVVSFLINILSINYLCKFKERNGGFLIKPICLLLRDSSDIYRYQEYSNIPKFRRINGDRLIIRYTTQ
jgi:hypothetical protein